MLKFIIAFVLVSCSSLDPRRELSKKMYRYLESADYYSLRDFSYRFNAETEAYIKDENGEVDKLVATTNLYNELRDFSEMAIRCTETYRDFNCSELHCVDDKRDEAFEKLFKTCEKNGDLERLAANLSLKLNYTIKVSNKVFESKIRPDYESFKKEIDDEKLALEQQKAEEEGNRIKEELYKNSEKSYYDQYCSYMSLKKTYEAKIKNEKEASKISGFVDKNKMYEWGHGIIGLTDMMKNIDVAFSKKFNKKLDVSTCQCDYKNEKIGYIKCTNK